MKQLLSSKPLIVLYLLIAIVMIFENKHRFHFDLSIKEAQRGSWIPNGCKPGTALNEHCHGGDGIIGSHRCRLGDDGYIYHFDQPIAKFAGGYKPLISDPLPRRGAELRMQDLETGVICTSNSLTAVSLLGI